MANSIQKWFSSSKRMSAGAVTGNLLYNRFLLYFFLFVSVVDLYYLSATHDYTSIVVFIITGILVSFFNKNMIVIMVIALTTMHLLKFGIKSTVNEGMKDSADASTGEEEEPVESFHDEEPHDNHSEPSTTAGPKVKSGDKAQNSSESESDKAKKISKSDDLETKKNYLQDINSEMSEFEDLQKRILKGLNDISPLMDKAENFIEKIQNKYPSPTD